MWQKERNWHNKELYTTHYKKLLVLDRLIILCVCYIRDWKGDRRVSWLPVPSREKKVVCKCPHCTKLGEIPAGLMVLSYPALKSLSNVLWLARQNQGMIFKHESKLKQGRNREGSMACREKKTTAKDMSLQHLHTLQHDKARILRLTSIMRCSPYTHICFVFLSIKNS